MWDLSWCFLVSYRFLFLYNDKEDDDDDDEYNQNYQNLIKLILVQADVQQEMESGWANIILNSSPMDRQ